MPRTAHASPAVHPSSDRPATGSEWRAGCDHCSASYTLPAWLRLPIVAHVESAWLAAHVMGWSGEEVIEVRRCARCSTAMSRRRPSDVDGAADSGTKANGG
jgi:hypothetical protein